MYYKISLFSYILYTVIWVHSNNETVLTQLQALWLLVKEDNTFIFILAFAFVFMFGLYFHVLI